MRFRFLLVCGLLVCLIVASAAHATDRMRLVSIPLDMPLSDEEALDNQALEGLYQGDYGKNMTHNVGGYLSDNVKSSGLVGTPFSHIETVLKDGRKLQLWFSSAADGRKTFGVRLETPYTEKPKQDFAKAISALQAAWGKPDLELSPSDANGQQIEIFVDRAVPKKQVSAIVARLPKPDTLPAKDVNDFWDMDLRDYARILGENFRGVIAIVNQQNGKLVSEQILLIDLGRAATVFNLGQGK